jgi:protocatechuate 3,4-dioxygenase beta subunit
VKKFLFAAIVAALSTSTFAQGGPGGGLGQPPPQGAGAGRGQRPVRAQTSPADVPKGTAILRGSIVAADNGSPIRRAQIRVNAPDARESRVATTDAQGRFEIKELPAGRYTMTASKGGFVSLQYGQRRPTESGTPIELADGQTIDKLSIALPRGSVIGGRITDEFGEPVANASVTALRYVYAAGARRMQPAGQNARDTTDDQGQFRLFGLPPGDYYVSATLRTGLEATDPSGETPGYASTYYPGTSNVAEASRVPLALGQQNTNVSFGLIATRLVRVSGQVLTSDGTPATNGMIMLMAANAGGRPGQVFQQGGNGGRVDANGTFHLTNVAPGHYQLQARSSSGGPGGPGGPGGLRGGFMGRDFELARMDLTVGNDDVEGLTLVTAAGASVSGSIVTDSGEPFDIRPTQLQITARPANPDATAFGGGFAGSRVGDDWSFTLNNINDAVLIRTGGAQNWNLKSVSINGQDITDTPMEFPPGSAVTGMQVVLTKKSTTLSGQVTDSKGTPVLDATVVIFPSNEKLWTYQSRFIKAARPDQDGQYRVTALPPESYLVVALQGLEDGQAGDPEFLATIKELATKLDLGDGESKAVDVKLSTVK